MDALKDERIRRLEAISERICENIDDGADVEELWTAVKQGIEDTANEIVGKKKRVSRQELYQDSSLRIKPLEKLNLYRI